ncbi:ankyrin repeat-containing domain protein [Aspergillus cavernicola]|uniref:Ankyrin repeat-containing domain protein n=1 Tax=Aspergillus cavernicola TaxID=176166 RepID=A0ABR4HR12_9EURO
MSHNEYTVGIICALPFEAAAAVTMLDEEYKTMPAHDLADHNTYRFGRLHQHKVVIASLPSGVYGTTSAATVAKDMLRTFQSLRVGLMVGIGGAAPVPDSEEQDIRLGDVIISKPSGAFGGLVQFDYGKHSQVAGLIRKGTLPAPPFSLLTALSKLESDLELGESTIPEHLATALQRGPTVAKRFGHPGIVNDVLYEQDYVHPTSAATCANCDVSRQIPRQERESTEPVIFCGNIASSNSVIKNAILRDQLRQELDVLCFEMEAAGLVDFPCLVLRGISDYSDSHKNNRWQRYAAATAAACAKSLLGCIATTSVLNEQPIVQVSDPVLQAVTLKQLAQVERIGNSLDTSAQRKEIRYKDDQQSKCLQFFDVLPYLSYKNRNPDRVAGSCRWVLESSQYRNWLDRQQDDLLWISADPGCGKSVLAKAIIDENLSADKYTVCYFFFRDDERQTNISLALCCLLHQLFQQQPHLLSRAIELLKSKSNTLKQDPDELWRLFVAASTDTTNSRPVICVFDALDECSEKDRRQLMYFFNGFCTQALQNTPRETQLKIIVTSRPYFEFDSFLKTPDNPRLLRLAGEFENQKIQDEIDLVIKVKIGILASHFGLKEMIREKVEARMLAMKNRTYLWVSLVIAHLEHSIGQGQKFRTRDLDQLPSNVEEAYEKILDRHTGNISRRHDALILLHIIVGARRSMTVQEIDVAFNLAQQVAIDDYDYQHDLDDEFLDGEFLVDRIRNLCGLFVFVVDERVHLFHQTAKEFLLSKASGSMAMQDPFIKYPFINMANVPRCWKGSTQILTCDLLLAQVCISCLLILDPGSQIRDIVTISGESEQLKPLFEYSAAYWPDHYRDASLFGPSVLQTKVMRLYHVAHTLQNTWFDVHAKRNFQWKNYRGQPCPAVLASLLGHLSLFKLISDCDKSQADTDSQSLMDSFLPAVRGGHEKVVNYLLDRGLTDIGEKAYGIALLVAAVYGYTPIVQTLLQHRNNASIRIGGQSKDYTRCVQSAIWAASGQGHLEVVRLLAADQPALHPVLDYAVDVAAGNGHETIVRLLLDKRERDSQEKQQKGKDYLFFPLRGATGAGNLRLMQYLLALGADPDGKPQGSADDYSSPSGIFNSMRQGMQTKLRPTGGAPGELLDENIGEESYQTALLGIRLDNLHYRFRASALMTAVRDGNLDAVSLLLAHGANINKLYQTGPSTYFGALETSLLTNNPQIAELLIMRGATVQRRDESQHLNRKKLADNFHPVVLQLLKNGFDLKKTTKEIYVSAVHTAVRLDCLEAAEMLTQKEPSIIPSLSTSLTEFVREEAFSFIEFMITCDIDPDRSFLSEFDGQSLADLVKERAFSVVEFLLDNGVDPERSFLSEFEGSSFAAFIKSTRNLPVVEFLLRHGADPRRLFLSEFDGAYLATLLKETSDVPLVVFLLENGVDSERSFVSEFNDDMLAKLVKMGNMSVLEFLLKNGVSPERSFMSKVDPDLAHHTQWGSFDRVKSLLNLGADPNVPGEKFSKIALHWAAEEGNEDLVVLLLEKGSEPNTLDCFGQTALHYAAEKGYEGITRCLRSVTNTSIVDTKGRTALRCARDGNHIGTVKLLLAFRTPSDNCRDRHNKSLMNWMAAAEYHDGIPKQ